ncbi:chymotrypsinogen A-like [Lutzomyia longipalpis]|uniref:chymotrypsinogen A-like n=1 Tax=Lutzomyia longipalpis TaxID=7200 RepID=UPI0024837208|nr:chymotrypsinogen A-like [Lutzomyia longipalpis]
MMKIILEILVTIFFVTTFFSTVEPNPAQPVLSIHQAYAAMKQNDSIDIVSRIVNGQLAVDGQFPHQVRIVFYGTLDCAANRKLCGGSIIAKNWILTAGHCVFPDLLDTIFAFEIQAGSVIADQPQQRKVVLVANAFPHPDYNPDTLENDIGLLKVDIGFNFDTPLVQPIALVAANTDKASYVGKIVTASGFGYTHPDDQHSSPELYYTQLEVIDFELCKTLYADQAQAHNEEDGGIADTSFCAKGLGNSSTCEGDSGSAVFLEKNGETGKRIQIGLVSYSSALGCNTLPGGYTDVALYIPWIEETMKANSYKM